MDALGVQGEIKDPFLGVHSLNWMVNTSAPSGMPSPLRETSLSAAEESLTTEVSLPYSGVSGSTGYTYIFYSVD